MIEIKKLNKTYVTGTNRLHVLQDIDLHIERGEFVSIMGSSGSGKSTLLNIIGLLDSYDTGSYTLNDVPIVKMGESKMAGLRNAFLGFVFQSFNLISYKNAMENVALPLYYQNVKRKKRNALALEYLEKVGLKEWAGHLPTELSGGQCQRVAIARAMVTRPKVILADEPTGALDSKTSFAVMDLFRRINEEGTTLLIVTHEHDIADKTERTIHLSDGMITANSQEKGTHGR